MPSALSPGFTNCTPDSSGCGVQCFAQYDIGRTWESTAVKGLVRGSRVCLNKQEAIPRSCFPTQGTWEFTSEELGDPSGSGCHYLFLPSPADKGLCAEEKWSTVSRETAHPMRGKLDFRKKKVRSQWEGETVGFDLSEIGNLSRSRLRYFGFLSTSHVPAHRAPLTIAP